MNRLVPPERKVAPSAGQPADTKFASRRSGRARSEAIDLDLRLLGLAQTYLRACRLRRETGPSLRAAWGMFYASLDPLIRSQVRAHGGSALERADRVQDVWAAILVHLPAYCHDPARGRFQDWLFVVTRRTLARRRRREERCRFDCLEPEVEEQLPGREADPAMVWERRDLIEWFHEILLDFRDRVDPVAFRAGYLHWIDGWSVAAVAAELHLSQGQCRGCLNRLKRKLHAYLTTHHAPLAEK